MASRVNTNRGRGYGQEDTGFRYPDGSPIYTTDKVRVAGFSHTGVVYARRANENNGFKRDYYYVSINTEVAGEHRLVSLAKCVEAGIEWYRPPAAMRKKEKARRRAEVRKCPNKKELYIVGPLDYDHVELGYK